ncbi:hypothetical protein EJB05_28441, partial [Eragrostis curvula]
MRPLLVLALILVTAGLPLEGADGAGECRRAAAYRVALRLAPCISAAADDFGAGECGRASVDTVALTLVPCISATDDPESTPNSSCCSAVKKIGQSPSCFCAVVLSNIARAAGIKPEVGITLPKRCSIADRPVGYKCGGEELKAGALVSII